MSGAISGPSSTASLNAPLTMIHGAATNVAILTATWTRAASSLRRKSAWVSSQCDALTNEFSALKLAARQMPSRNKYAAESGVLTAVLAAGRLRPELLGFSCDQPCSRAGRAARRHSQRGAETGVKARCRRCLVVGPGRVSAFADAGSWRTWRRRGVQLPGLPSGRFLMRQRPGVVAAQAAWRVFRLSSAAARSRV